MWRFTGSGVADLHSVHVGSAHQAHNPLHTVRAGPAGHPHPGHALYLLLGGGGGTSHTEWAGLTKHGD